MTDDEWGPWLYWGGGSNPAKGMFVQIEIRGDWTGQPVGDPDGDYSAVWAWQHDGGHDDIIRYRIRKPRAMKILTDILREVEKETEDA